MNNINLIIDFDSTFVKVETLDILAAICFEKDSNKTEKINAIIDITNKAMNGEIAFNNALSKRVKILKTNKSNIEKATEIIKTNISDSFHNNQKFFKENANNCFIVSGGFKEIILPIVKPYGFKNKNVYGNSFIYKNDGSVFTIDKKNCLSQELGKVKVADKINKPTSISNKKKTTVILGDGYTDYELKKHNEADFFIQFIENVNRKSLNNKADLIANNFDEVIEFIKLHDE